MKNTCKIVTFIKLLIIADTFIGVLGQNYPGENWGDNDNHE